MKTCTACRQTLPLHHFFADRRRLDGHTARCKPCSRKDLLARRTRSRRDEPYRREHTPTPDPDWLGYGAIHGWRPR